MSRSGCEFFGGGLSPSEVGESDSADRLEQGLPPCSCRPTTGLGDPPPSLSTLSPPSAGGERGGGGWERLALAAYSCFETGLPPLTSLLASIVLPSFFFDATSGLSSSEKEVSAWLSFCLKRDLEMGLPPYTSLGATSDFWGRGGEECLASAAARSSSVSLQGEEGPCAFG